MGESDKSSKELLQMALSKIEKEEIENKIKFVGKEKESIKKENYVWLRLRGSSKYFALISTCNADGSSIPIEENNPFFIEWKKFWKNYQPVEHQ